MIERRKELKIDKSKVIWIVFYSGFRCPPIVTCIYPNSLGAPLLLDEFFI
uniref:Uncharacterized protein n=1 Tax=Meloidogyne enterolobii TaxID=390850 RepID=A0A6V7TTC2_MELEN|nr:unnamed protein product [Meloidogyne enterolobii]